LLVVSVELEAGVVVAPGMPSKTWFADVVAATPVPVGSALDVVVV
jgi:hypothetical protein